MLQGYLRRHSIASFARDALGSHIQYRYRLRIDHPMVGVVRKVYERGTSNVNAALRCLERRKSFTCRSSVTYRSAQSIVDFANFTGNEKLRTQRTVSPRLDSASDFDWILCFVSIDRSMRPSQSGRASLRLSYTGVLESRKCSFSVDCLLESTVQCLYRASSSDCRTRWRSRCSRLSCCSCHCRLSSLISQKNLMFSSCL